MYYGQGQCDRCNHLAAQIAQNELEWQLYRTGSEEKLRRKDAVIAQLEADNKRLRGPMCFDVLAGDRE